jgi:acetylornithine deacetylase
MTTTLEQRVVAAVDRDRLVATASDLVAISSPTGREEEAARYLAAALRDAGMEASVQDIEAERANAVGRLPGRGAGPSLMFNGHLDTSYSGDEPWLTGPGYRPAPLLRDGAIVGLGIMNMKGAVACYVEAVRALRDAGATLEGELIVAGVAGEIEKTEWGEYRGSQYRGYGVGARHLVESGVLTDACIIGEPTEERLVLGHFGTMWVRISTTGSFVHTAFSQGRLEENSIVRMQDVVASVVEWIPEWEKAALWQGKPGVVNIGAVQGGFPWRVSRTPLRTDLFLDVRVPPSIEMTEAAAVVETLAGSLRRRFPDHGIEVEIYVSTPGADITPSHPVVTAVDDAHRTVFGVPPEHDYVVWASDASTLSRAGVATVNYGPIASALPGPEGESVPVDSLLNIAASYAVTAIRFCGAQV